MEAQQTHFYPIGSPGVPWGDQERERWRRQQKVQRSYQELVVARLQLLPKTLELIQYGELDYEPEAQPLFAVRNRWQEGAPIMLVTGGVHGYETSGVLGALKFLESHADNYQGRVNLLVAPCISPWAFERIHRWNALAIDPNRSFKSNTVPPATESTQLMNWLAPWLDSVLMHIDLHETTDTDESEFRPALAARDGKDTKPGLIPDGFYVVGDSANPALEFQRAIIEALRKVTHIAPADEAGEIIGSKVVSEGVILYDFKGLGLCAGMTKARFTSTTEVYPDSPRSTPAQCDEAQVAAVCAAIEFALAAD
jgi:hypothetical protein